MRVKEQFNRYAITYNQHSIIQEKIAKILVNEIDFDISNVADLGSGSGRIYRNFIEKNINFKEFYAIDFAPSMLSLHPEEKRVKKIYGDFNNKKLFNQLKDFNIDLVISSSALQWAKDLNFTFKQIAKVSPHVLFFIFSSNTFKSLHNFIGVKSPIYEQEFILKAFDTNFIQTKVEIYNFKLKFENNLEMLRYIKNSGVSGGLNVGYKALKKVVKSYPKSLLEFEAILLKGVSR